MVDAMLKSTKQRRDAKRNALENDYQASKTETRDSIDKNFSKHGKNVLIMHRGQLERLVELLKRKEDIERQMAASVETLEQAYLARAAELRAALNGRIEKLH
ncbi:Major facilitator superfamily [Neofusicoccum parvum]|uniref:Major facilitator superfamily n=1 Tax=Neofusicoccum parvum TaxID=310453 RepID=A0ACB5RZZ6_9PEZI|nr:Major facilitator superfamily [Neofusicoccum parvum]